MKFRAASAAAPIAAVALVAALAHLHLTWRRDDAAAHAPSPEQARQQRQPPPPGRPPRVFDGDAATAAAEHQPAADPSTSRAQPRRAPDLSCFLYDRPPRTGSTTVYLALKNCTVAHHGMTTLRYEHLQDEYALVSNLFAYGQGSFRVMVSKHLKLSPSDLSAIRARCSRLFYVSSARPMRERLWSRGKYVSVPGHANSTLGEEESARAQRRMEKQNEWYETYLENNPYLKRGGVPADVSERDRLVPDYVLRNGRNGHFAEDLEQLLTALRCPANFTAVNVHQSEKDDLVLQKIRLKHGDAIYKRLLKASENNGQGLEKARRFIDEVLEERDEIDAAAGGKKKKQLPQKGRQKRQQDAPRDLDEAAARAGGKKINKV